jgi:hypothetical protein
LEPSNPGTLEPSDAWLAALIDRHTSGLRRSEFLKAVRALSARYVERRSTLAEREPVDSPGKRAAFAGFYAPLHFFTAGLIVEAVGAGAARVDRLVDLGCGTGVAGAAWALACESRPTLLGVDRQPWMLQDAEWNWRQLDLSGRVRRGDLVLTAERLAGDRRDHRRTGVVLAWAVNELDEGRRDRLLRAVCTLASRGASLLVIEPVARSAAPWWNDWVRAASDVGGRGADWKFDRSLPPALAALDEAAGFRREGLAGRSLWLRGEAGSPTSGQ